MINCIYFVPALPNILHKTPNFHSFPVLAARFNPIELF